MTNYEKALTTLEFDKIAQMLADCALTEGAKAKAKALVPDHDAERIRKQQKRTSDAKNLISVKGTPTFGNVRDIGGALERAEKGAPLSVRELLDVAAVLNTARRLIDYRSGKNGDDLTGSLSEDFSRLITDRQLEDRITRTIIAEDMIADEASPELSDIRRKIKGANNRIKDSLQKYVSGGAFSKALQENIVTMRNGRYVVPVKAECRNEIKGLVHDTSASGATLFIEPLSVVEANNELRELQSKEQHEIDRILAELSALCASVSGILMQDYHTITELSFVFAKAELSFRMKALEPEISDKRIINLRSARHPLIDQNKVVPITVTLGGDYDTLVITGPNTGGKTVTLKTVGLFALMAQSGLHLPTNSDSVICVFDSVLADIGDEQSIEQSLSTFSAHMVNIVDILKKADNRSLVLLDELGAGTDPTEGASLAISILEKLRSDGAMCAATTHYAELKVWALDTEGVTNASCEFDIATLRPTYRLIIGTPGKSNAFAISQRLGLDDDIIQNAKDRISSDNKRFEFVIEKLEESRIEMERKLAETERMRKEYEQFKNENEKKLRAEFENAEKELEKSRAKAVQIIESARVTSDYVLAELDEVKRRRESEELAGSLDRARREIRRSLRGASDSINPVIENTNENYEPPRDYRTGDTVLLVNINKQGTITEGPDKDGNVVVRSGLINTKTTVKNLRLVEEAVTVTSADKKKTAAASYRAVVNKNFSPSLDLRGQLTDDAWFMVDKYLDEAKVARMQTVTIIHGKGTGALRNALHKCLKADSRVKSFRLGNYGEGDTGVTIVELK